MVAIIKVMNITVMIIMLMILIYIYIYMYIHVYTSINKKSDILVIIINHHIICTASFCW